MTKSIDKKIFMDFGCGKNVGPALQAKEEGYYAILIDRKEKHILKHTDLPIEYFETIADELLFFNVAGPTTLEYKADLWHCGAVMEHVHTDHVDDFLKGICRNIKDDSVGNLNIDLTDHFGGFDHYDRPRHYMHFIKNQIRLPEWIEIMERFFKLNNVIVEYRIEGDKRPSTITFLNLRKHEDFCGTDWY